MAAIRLAANTSVTIRITWTPIDTAFFADPFVVLILQAHR
jgi:hypothetical protein